MSNLIQRAYPRKVFEAPMQYATPNSGQFRCTQTRNYSAGGLCFETDRQLEPGTEVYVVMDTYAPERSGPESYRSYLARVRWTQPLAPRRTDRYAAGTQIMARSREVLTANAETPRQTCDLCGALMQECGLQCTDENAQLCEPCYRHYGKLPKGKTRECVERFLVGNVV